MRRCGARAPFACALALWLIAGVSAPSTAETGSIRTECRFLAYDAPAKTVTVEVEKPGAGPAAEALAVGRPAVFHVEPEGSVVTRTSVWIRGVKASLDAIPSGGKLIVYWRPDPADPQLRFARKIDVLLSEEELDVRGGTE
jgi:hypothetical protein